MMDKGEEEPDKDKGNCNQNGSSSISDRLAELSGNMEEINRVKRKYPMKITRYYLDLIRSKDDPIWKQSVPAVEEVEDDFNVEDPLQEEEHTPVPYLVHKYPDRVLLLVSSMCAMYCRFCTRKRKVGRIQQIPLEDIFRAIDYIKEHKEVRDVVVSGGDPLMRADNEIEEILRRLREIPHLDIIRIGTRMPCVQPARITPHLVNILKKYHPLFMNIHFNHPNEITPESSAALKLLADGGVDPVHLPVPVYVQRANQPGQPGPVAGLTASSVCYRPVPYGYSKIPPGNSAADYFYPLPGAPPRKAQRQH